MFVLLLYGDGQALELVREEYTAGGGRFSPDNRFFAYASDESGRNEVYVRPFDASSGRFSSDGLKWQVSTQGGSGVSWSRSTAELYYIAEDGGVMSVDVATTSAFKAGPPEPLFRAPTFANTVDGQRFAGLVSTPQPEPLIPLPERKVVALSPEILARYVGRYAWSPFDEDEDAVVTLEGNQLMIQTNYLFQARPLLAESETRFSNGDQDFEFVKDEKGIVMHVISGNMKWTRK